MNNYRGFELKNDNVIVEKSENFAVRIVRLYQFLCDEKKEFILSKQLLRCGTSIGANIHEATHGESKLDFIHKLSIALKEANETSYWLRLLYKTQYLTQTQCKSINTDCKEFLKLLTSIIKTAKKNLDN